MFLHARPYLKDIFISLAILVATLAATLFVAHLPLPPGINYYDHNPLGWVALFGVPLVSVVVAASMGMNWKRFALALLLTFVVIFILAYLYSLVVWLFR